LTYSVSLPDCAVSLYNTLHNIC